MYCGNCGKQIRDHSKYCGYCGAAVSSQLPKSPQVQQLRSFPAAHGQPGSFEKNRAVRNKPHPLLLAVLGLVLLPALIALLSLIAGGADGAASGRGYNSNAGGSEGRQELLDRAAYGENSQVDAFVFDSGGGNFGQGYLIVTPGISPVTPVRLSCPRCQGAGKVVCSTCGGSGYYALLDKRCPRCSGDGYVICTGCFGTGLVN